MRFDSDQSSRPRDRRVIRRRLAQFQFQKTRRLATPEAAQLCQRISILTTLISFDLEDTTPAAVRLIWEHSGGVPREINTLCFNALLLTTAAERKQVDSDILHEVVADLDLNPIRFNPGKPRRGIRGVKTADVLRLGDAAAAPATNVDKT